MNLFLSNTRVQFILFALAFIASVAAALYTSEYWLALAPFVLLILFASWHAADKLFYVLIASLPFSMEFQFNSTLGTDLPDELLMILVSGIFILYLFYRPKALTPAASMHPLLWLVALGFLWSFISTIFSTQPLLSIKYLLAKCWYIGAFIFAALIVLNSKTRIKRSIYFFSISLLLVTIIILFRHAMTGWTFAGINDAVSPFFRNHVNYSAMMVCLVPILIVYRSSLENIGRRRIINFLIIVLIAAIFLSYARGAWIAVLIGLMSAWLLKRRMLLNAFIVVFLLIAGTVSWLKSGDRYLQYAHDYRSTIFHENFSDHLIATYRFKDVSTAERFNRWIAGIRMANDHPITGFGPSTFYKSYKPYTIPAFRTWVSDNPEKSTVHNYFLLILVEQGVPGLLLFLILSGAILFYCQRIYHRSDDPLFKGIALAVSMIYPMILLLNFLSDLIETDKIGSIFFLCVAMLIIADSNSRKKQEQVPVN